MEPIAWSLYCYRQAFALKKSGVIPGRPQDEPGIQFGFFFIPSNAAKQGLEPSDANVGPNRSTALPPSPSRTTCMEPLLLTAGICP